MIHMNKEDMIVPVPKFNTKRIKPGYFISVTRGDATVNGTITKLTEDIITYDGWNVTKKNRVPMCILSVSELITNGKPVHVEIYPKED
jgi:hypothetical protein